MHLLIRKIPKLLGLFTLYGPVLTRAYLASDMWENGVRMCENYVTEVRKRMNHWASHAERAALLI